MKEKGHKPSGDQIVKSHKISSLAGLVQAMGIVSVDLKVLRHVFVANSIFNFIIRDYRTLGVPCCVTTLWIMVYILEINLTKVKRLININCSD